MPEGTGPGRRPGTPLRVAADRRVPHPTKEIHLTTVDPFIASLSHIHSLRPDADNGDLTVRALTAETRHLMVRMEIAIAWGRENLTDDMEPKAGAAFYRIDAFIRSLVDSHHLSALPGESDISLTLRALGTEFGAIGNRAQAVVKAIGTATADRTLRSGTQPLP